MSLIRFVRNATLAALLVLAIGCGGGDSGAGGSGPAATSPTIATQPASTSSVAGRTARRVSFGANQLIVSR
jgi:hypothetical protein